MYACLCVGVSVCVCVYVPVFVCVTPVHISPFQEPSQGPVSNSTGFPLPCHELRLLPMALRAEKGHVPEEGERILPDTGDFGVTEQHDPFDRGKGKAAGRKENSAGAAARVAAKEAVETEAAKGAAAKGAAARAAAKEAVETEAVKEAVEAEEAATEAAAGAAKEAVETEAVETEAAAEAKPVVGSAKENSGRASQISADRDGSSCANEDSAGRKDDWLSGVGWHMAGVGELCVRGAATFEGYHGKPHLTAQVHRNRWSSSSSRRSSRSSSTSPILGMFFKVDFCVRGAATFEGYHGKPHLTAQVKISLVIIYIYIYIYIYMGKG